jgi:hypothetical protein
MSSIILPTFAARERWPSRRAWGLWCLRSLTAAANPHREGRTLQPMQLLGVCVRSASGIRPVHCKPQPSRRDTHALAATYANPNCPHRPYQLPQRQMGTAAFQRRSSSCTASSGFVWKRTDSGMLAARHRSRSSHQSKGRESSRSMRL